MCNRRRGYLGAQVTEVTCSSQGYSHKCLERWLRDINFREYGRMTVRR